MHNAGSQSESETVISDIPQHFEPREDDNETLYEVIEITGERARHYRVRWKGSNPKTKKPWPQSWVLKQDCTDDLVSEWNGVMKRKEIKNNRRDSRASKRISHSVVSSARRKSRSAGPANVQSKSKGCFEEYDDSNDAILIQQRTTIEVGPSNPISLADHSPPLDVQFNTTTKRKLAEAHPTNSSTNKRQFDIKPLEVGRDGGQTARTDIKPSRKKRKIMTDVDGPPRNIATQNHEKKSKDVNNDGCSRLKLFAANNEKVALGAVKERSKYDEVPAEEMIEHISHGFTDANHNSWNDDFGVKSQNVAEGDMQRVKDRHKGNQVHAPQVEEDEECGVAVVKASNQTQRAISLIARAMPSAYRKGPSNGRQTTDSTGTHISGVRTLNTRPAAPTKKSKESCFAVLSSTNQNPEPNLLPSRDPGSDGSPHRKAQRPKPTIESQRNDDAEIHDFDDPDERVTLTPGARQRLALFDIEVMGEEMRSVEKKQSMEMVGGLGEASILKCPKPLENGRPAISTVRSTLRFGNPPYFVDVVSQMELEDSQEQLSATVEKGTVAEIDSSTANPSASKSCPHSTFHPHPQRLPPDPPFKIAIEPLSLHERRPEIDGIEQFELSEKGCSNRFTKKRIVLTTNGAVETHRLGSKTDKGGCAEEVLELETVRRQEIFERAEAARRQVYKSSTVVSTPAVTTNKKQEVAAHTHWQYRSTSRLDDEENKKLDNCAKDTLTDINPEVWRPDEESAQDTVAEQRQLQVPMNLKETNTKGTGSMPVKPTPTSNMQGLYARHLKLVFTNPITCNVEDLRSIIDPHIANLRKQASLKTKNIVQITSLLNGEILVEMEDGYCMEKFITAVQRMGMLSCEPISLDYYRTASSASCVSWAWTEQYRRRFGLRRGGKKILKSDEAELVP